MTQKRYTGLDGSVAAVHTRGAEVHQAIVRLDLTTDNLEATAEDVHPLIEIPAEAIVTSIKAANSTALDGASGLLIDVGLYKMTKPFSLGDLFSDHGGIASDSSNTYLDTLDTDNYSEIDADEYVDGSDIFQTGPNNLTEIMNVDPENLYMTVRDRAGDGIGETPMKYFLGMAVATAVAGDAAAGEVTFIIEYIQG
jgi:hypothetical protein